MKKIAAATLAATMALSLGAVDANAASNTMSNLNHNCRVVTAMGIDNITPDTAQEYLKMNPELDAKVVGSADMAEAFGSGDSATIDGRETFNAYKACANRENYQSQPMTDTKKALVITGTVISALVLIGGVLAPVVGPMIQQFLPF